MFLLHRTGRQHTTITRMSNPNDFLWVNHTEPLQTACYCPCGLVSNVHRTRRLWHRTNVHNERFTHTLADAHIHLKTQLSGLLGPICLEHICQCSIKNPSDKRFKWLPLWVMSSCISEEAFTARQMKTDEKDHCLRPDLPSCLSGTYANAAQQRYMHRDLHVYVVRGVFRVSHHYRTALVAIWTM